MDDDETILVTIDAIYDAALDPSRWPAALTALAGFMGSQAATFWVLGGGREPGLSEFAYINFDSAFIREYLDGMANEDPTVQFLLSHPNDSVIHDGQYLSERDIDKHHYYDWHFKNTDARYRLLGQIRPAPAIQAGVALHRTRKAGRFDSADLALFQSVYPHLQRSLTIGFRLGTLGVRYQTMSDLLDRERIAMLLLDSRGLPLHHNAKLEALVKAADGIGMDSSGLVLADAGSDQYLSHLIEMACPTRSGRRMSGFMQVTRPSGKRAYQLFVTPVADVKTELTVWAPAVCVGITDPADDLSDALPRIKEAFGLTTAEGHLACLLAAGEDLRASAERLGIQYETARARLTDIFEKTATHRQGELVSLLLTTIMMN